MNKWIIRRRSIGAGLWRWFVWPPDASRSHESFPGTLEGFSSALDTVRRELNGLG